MLLAKDATHAKMAPSALTWKILRDVQDAFVLAGRTYALMQVTLGIKKEQMTEL